MKDIIDKQVTAAMDDLAEKARTQIATGASIDALAKSLLAGRHLLAGHAGFLHGETVRRGGSCGRGPLSPSSSYM